MSPVGVLQCKKCRNFRPLRSYPNLLKNPERALEYEIEELAQRRKLELKVLSEKDSVEINDMFYIINCDWI
jgi:hypothetical protein